MAGRAFCINVYFVSPLARSPHPLYWAVTFQCGMSRIYAMAPFQTGAAHTLA